MAAEVFAICIREKMPSCMRAPPEAEKTIAGHLSSMRALEDAGDLLAHHRAHGAAHELEDEAAHGDLVALDAAHAGDERVVLAQRSCGWT